MARRWGRLWRRWIESRRGQAAATREGQDFDAETKDEEEVRGLRTMIGNRMRVSLPNYYFSEKVMSERQSAL